MKSQVVPHLFVKYFLSLQSFVFSALWSPQPFELPSFLVSKLFGPPKLSLVVQPWLPWLLILEPGLPGTVVFCCRKKVATTMCNIVRIKKNIAEGCCCHNESFVIDHHSAGIIDQAHLRSSVTKLQADVRTYSNYFSDHDSVTCVLQS